MKGRLVPIVGMLVGVCAPSLVRAQTAAQISTQSDKRNDDDLTRDIIVTANKVVQKSQSVAGSLSVVRGEDLVTQHKQRLDDALQGVPGVQVQRLSTGFAIAIRGISVETPSGIGDPAAALNYDGVYTDRPEAGRTGFFDVSRVEVLRGPQGTLYGRNSTAGVVNVITNDPVEKAEGAASLSYGNYHLVETNGMINVPLAEGVALRGAVYYQLHDGYLSNGQDDADDFGARLKLLLAPSTALRIVIGTEYAHVAGEGPGSTATFSSGHGPRYYNTPASSGNSFSFDNYKIYSTASLAFGGAYLTVTPSYQDYSAHTLTNLGSFNVVYDTKEKQTGLEARLSSQAGKHLLDWTVGAFYYDGTIDVITTQPVFQTQLSKTRSYAGFGDLTVNITDGFRANGGLRYTRDEKDITNTATVGSATTVASLDRDFERVDYKIGVEGDITEESMLYAKVATGFRSGGLYGALSGQSFRPEKLTSFEVGSKNRFLDRRMTLNLSAFYYDYRNYQATNVVFVGGAPVNAVFNAPGAETYGAELQTNFALTQNDQLGAGVAYLHARFKDGFILNGIGYGEEVLGKSPEWTLTGSYAHTFRLGSGATLIARADSKFESTSYVTFVQNEATRQHPYTVTNAQLTYTNPSGRFSVGAFVKNIEYTVVKAQFLDIPPSPLLAVQSPRTYGVQVAAHF